MNEKLKELLEESIKLESNVAKIYLLFSGLFKKDYEFWWKLYTEESNHAALIRSVLDFFLPFDQYPEKMICKSLAELQTTNKNIEDLYKKFEKDPPDRELAFKTALEMENAPGEIHFQDFMKHSSNNSIDEIFQKLNNSEIDHYKRIKLYMKKTSNQEY